MHLAGCQAWIGMLSGRGTRASCPLWIGIRLPTTLVAIPMGRVATTSGQDARAPSERVEDRLTAY